MNDWTGQVEPLLMALVSIRVFADQRVLSLQVLLTV